MRVLVTGSAGHLGEALMRLLPEHGVEAIGLDLAASPFTHHVGSITDRAAVRAAMAGAQAVVHAATLHKPHVATHAKQAFVDTNVAGTLCLLEEAVAAGCPRVVFTSTTSAFGAALTPAPDEPAAWIDEDVAAVPKNIYGVTKTAAEDLCALFARRHGLGCVVLRTSRFFPEADDDAGVRAAFPDANAKANEFLHRRVDLEDAAMAHLCALRSIAGPGFARYVVSATTPFTRADLAGLRRDPARLVAERVPAFERVYRALGFRMSADIGRVYANARAREDLGWRPRHDFASVLAQLERGEPIGSALARRVGVKAYHDEVFAKGPYPVETIEASAD
ncbi:MAG: NAD-dependent epimerase/dehydratase family protein [Paracoccaceae bacterium]